MLGWPVALDRPHTGVLFRSCCRLASLHAAAFLSSCLSLPPEKRNRSILATAHGCTQLVSDCAKREAEIHHEIGRSVAKNHPNLPLIPSSELGCCVHPNVVAKNGSSFFLWPPFCSTWSAGVKKRQPREAAGAWVSAKSTSAYASAVSGGHLRMPGRCLCEADCRCDQSAACATASAPERK